MWTFHFASSARRRRPVIGASLGPGTGGRREGDATWSCAFGSDFRASKRACECRACLEGNFHPLIREHPFLSLPFLLLIMPSTTFLDASSAVAELEKYERGDGLSAVELVSCPLPFLLLPPGSSHLADSSHSCHPCSCRWTRVRTEDSLTMISSCCPDTSTST